MFEIKNQFYFSFYRMVCINIKIDCVFNNKQITTNNKISTNHQISTYNIQDGKNLRL